MPFPVIPALPVVGSILMVALLALIPACKRETAEPDWSTSFTGCDVKKWPQLLPLAKRSQKEQISVTFYGDEKAPTADGSFKRLRSSEEQKCLLNSVKRNLSEIDTKMLKLQRYRTIINGRRILQYGYVYLGKTPQEPSAIRTIPPDAPDRAAKIKKVVWEELKHEGETSAINAYDSQLLTWGRGFGARAGLLPEVMGILFKDRAVAEAFHHYGIDFIASEKEKGYRVVNLRTGAVETGVDALRLIQTDPRLLGVFVKIAEDLRYSQQVADAQWEVVSKNAGAVPPYATNWDDRWIALVSHISHWWPAAGWRGKEKVASYAGVTTIKDLLIRFGRKAASTRPNGSPDGKPGGALVVANADTITNFKRWGDGVAWQAISKVSGYPIPFTGKQLADPKNTQFRDLVCILAPGGASYYFFDFLPTVKPLPPGAKATFIMRPDDLFVLVMKDLPMTDLLNSLAGLEVEELQARLNEYDQRPNYVAAFGVRPRIAMKAALLAMPETQATPELKRKLLDDPDYGRLNAGEQGDLKVFLGLQ
ncbi:MAG TPA: hypothetical protein VHR27_09710 [Blastocatellia bacterium]|nr:hypothetical protein [Blastocatellia bacterium]